MAQRGGGRGGDQRRRVDLDRRINRSMGTRISGIKGLMSTMMAVVAMMWNVEQREKPRYGSKYRERNNTWLKANKAARKTAYASRRFNRMRAHMLRMKRQKRRRAHGAA